MIASIRNEGIRVTLEAGIAASDHEHILEDLFSDLKDSGMRRVDLVISDGHKDFQNVAQRSFHG